MNEIEKSTYVRHPPVGVFWAKLSLVLNVLARELVCKKSYLFYIFLYTLTIESEKVQLLEIIHFLWHRYPPLD